MTKLGSLLLALQLASGLLQGVSSLDVVLLGDSYASGNGGGSYSGGDCHRSANCWGKQAADLLNAASFNNVACSGAEISALSSQDDAIDPSTDLVLLGTGGNDLNFGDIVLQCFVPFFRSHGECTYFTNQANSELPTLTANL